MAAMPALSRTFLGQEASSRIVLDSGERRGILWSNVREAETSDMGLDGLDLRKAIFVIVRFF